MIIEESERTATSVLVKKFNLLQFLLLTCLAFSCVEKKNDEKWRCSSMSADLTDKLKSDFHIERYFLNCGWIRP